MGSCVSFNKTMETGEKLEEKDDKLLVQENPDSVNGADSMDTNPPFSFSGFHGRGSKDETFFDSQPWLDSDCENENDFYSVNGDTTPSCGSTPVHHSFHSSQNLTIKPSILQPNDDVAPEPSPESGKKRLSELFRESLDGDEAYIELASSDSQKAYLQDDSSRSSDGRTSDREMNGKENESKTKQCCIPMMAHSRSTNGRRKKMSPAPTMIN